MPIFRNAIVAIFRNAIVAIFRNAILPIFAAVENYRQVSLTSLVMTIFEKFIKKEIFLDIF